MKRTNFNVAAIVVVIGLAGSCNSPTGEQEGPQPIQPAAQATASAPSSAPAEATANPEAAKPAGEEVAIYSVPSLDDALTAKLVGAISSDEGVVSVKGDSASGMLHVTFVPGKANPVDIAKALGTVSPDVKLEKVAAAEGPGHGSQPGHKCGGCPMQNVCGGNH